MKPRKVPRNLRVVFFSQQTVVIRKVDQPTCVCRQTFDSDAELTKHLRFAERRPHEKHRRAFVCV